MSDTIFLSGDYGYDSYRANGVESVTIDASDASWIVANVGDDINRYPVSVYNGSDVSLVGGTIVGEVPLDTDWGATYVNSTAIMVKDSDNALVKDWKITQAWDGIRIRGDEKNTFTIDGVYMAGIRDDAVENDSGLSGTIKNSMFDGVFVGLSTADVNTVANDNVVTLDNVLIRMESYEYRGEVTHISPFKVSSVSPDMKIYDTIIAIEDVNHVGMSRLETAWDKVVDASGNYYLNLSDEPLPANYPMPPKGFTVLQGEEARKFWESQKAEWLAAQNGEDLSGDSDGKSDVYEDDANADAVRDPTSNPATEPEENLATPTMQQASADVSEEEPVKIEAAPVKVEKAEPVETGNSTATTQTVVKAEPLTSQEANVPVDVQALEAANTVAPSYNVDTSSKAGEGLVAAINIGSENAYVAADGTVFAADTSGEGRVFKNAVAVAETEDDTIYQTEAWDRGGLSYNFDVEDGYYQVILHFAEIWDGALFDDGRVFDIEIEGSTVYDGLDLFEAAGAHTAYTVESFVEVDDGQLKIDLRKGLQNPKLSALEIRQADAADVEDVVGSNDPVGEAGADKIEVVTPTKPERADINVQEDGDLSEKVAQVKPANLFVDSHAAPISTAPISARLVAAFEGGGVRVGTDGTVLGWGDESSMGNDLVAQGDPKFIENATPTGRAAVAFDGSGDLLERLSATDTLYGLPEGNAERTMFLVVKYAANNGVSSGLVYGDGEQNEAFGLVSGWKDQDLSVQGWGKKNDFDSNIDIMEDRWIVQSVVLGDGEFEHFMNGVLIGSGEHEFATDAERLLIGGEIADLGQGEMEVAAALIYDEALNDEDRESVEEYLQAKYTDVATSDDERATQLNQEGLIAAFEEETIGLGSGNSVVGWTDGSGMGNDLSAAGDPTLAADATPNGRDAVKFDGSGDLLERVGAEHDLTGFAEGNDDRTMFFVVNYLDHQGVSSGLVYGDGEHNEAFGLVSGWKDEGLSVQGWGKQNDFDSNIGAPDQGWMVQSVVLDNGVFDHYLNGDLIDSAEHTFSTDVERLLIGAEAAEYGESKMEVAAALIYDRALSNGERTGVEDYLFEKYLDEDEDTEEVWDFI